MNPPSPFKTTIKSRSEAAPASRLDANRPEIAEGIAFALLRTTVEGDRHPVAFLPHPDQALGAVARPEERLRQFFRLLEILQVETAGPASFHGDTGRKTLHYRLAHQQVELGRGAHRVAGAA